MQVSAAVHRLNALLPLAERQAALEPRLRSVHRSILVGFLEHGVAPAVETADAAELAAVDLVVIDGEGHVTGAYPFTTEHTDHAVQTDGSHVHAMCSLDALAVAPVFDTTTRVVSRCAESGTPIEVVQDHEEVVSATPATPWIGIRWQEPCGSAATSLCREMVFLASEDEARRWRGHDAEDATVFPLVDAIEFATAFFGPLLAS